MTMSTKDRVLGLAVGVIGPLLGLLATSCGAPPDVDDGSVSQVDGTGAGGAPTAWKAPTAQERSGAVLMLETGRASVKTCGASSDGLACSYEAAAFQYQGTITGTCEASKCCLGCWDGTTCRHGVDDEACGADGAGACRDCRSAGQRCLMLSSASVPHFRCQ